MIKKDELAKIQFAKLLLLYMLMVMLFGAGVLEAISKLRLFGIKETYTVSYWIVALILILLGIIVPWSKNKKVCTHPELKECPLDDIDKAVSIEKKRLADAIQDTPAVSDDILADLSASVIDIFKTK